MKIARPASEVSAARRTTFAWLCLACTLLAPTSGCRTARDNQLDLMERELRTQEDYIYELEDYVCQYSEKLRQCRCSQPIVVTKATQSKSVIKKSKPTPAVDSDEPLRIDEEPYDEQEIETPVPVERSRRAAPPTGPVETAPESIEPSDLKIGDPVGRLETDSHVQAAVYESAAESNTADAISTLPPVDELVDAAEFQTLLGTEAARTPEQVVVTHLLRDETEDGGRLLAVVEARDANDEPVEVHGEVSLMVMTADSDKPSRLKRWDFTAEDAAAAWQSSHLGDGMHLELPLETTELPGTHLELWVRVVNADGSKLLAQVPFERDQLVSLNDGPSDQQLAQQDNEPSIHEAEGRLLSAEEPVEDPSDSRSGWKPSLVRSDAITPTVAASTKDGGAWTAQPAGGRYPQTEPVQAESSTKQPIWTAGRTSSAPAQRGSQPEWAPFR